MKQKSRRRPKTSGSADTVIIGYYYDDQKRLRPVTAKQYASSISKGVPARVRGAQKRESGAPIHVKMAKGMSMRDQITIDGVTKSRRAWLTDLSLYAEPVHFDPNTGWRPDHNRSDVLNIDLNTAQNVENFQKGLTPGMGKGRGLTVKVPEKPRDASKATIRRFDKHVNIDRVGSAEALQKWGLLFSEDNVMAVVVNKKKAKKNKNFRSVDGPDKIVLSDNVTYSSIRDKDSWDLGGSAIASEKIIDAVRVLGGKGDIIIKQHPDDKNRAVTFMNKQGDMVLIAPIVGGKPEGSFKDFVKLKGVTDLTLYQKHRLPSRRAREAGMDRTRELKGRTLVLFDRRGTFGFNEKKKVADALRTAGIRSDAYDMVPDPKNKGKPKSRHRFWLYVPEDLDVKKGALLDQSIATGLSRRRRKRSNPGPEKWAKEAISPTVETGWRKTQSAETRRRRLLDATDKRLSIHNRHIQAGRRAQAIANVTRDPDTKSKMRSDARYHFRRAEETKRA